MAKRHLDVAAASLSLDGSHRLEQMARRLLPGGCRRSDGKGDVTNIDDLEALIITLKAGEPTMLFLGMALLALGSGWLADKLGSRGLATGGMLVTAAGMFGLSLSWPTSGVLVPMAWMFVCGAGTGVFISPNSSALMAILRHQRAREWNRMVAHPLPAAEDRDHHFGDS